MLLQFTAQFVDLLILNFIYKTNESNNYIILL